MPRKTKELNDNNTTSVDDSTKKSAVSKRTTSSKSSQTSTTKTSKSNIISSAIKETVEAITKSRKKTATSTTTTTKSNRKSASASTASKPKRKSATTKPAKDVKDKDIDKNIEDLDSGKKTKKATVKKTKKSSEKVLSKTALKKTPSAVPAKMEYYDLPYSYNKTVIMLLAQTPNTLFVYWELSMDDVNSFLNRYGQNFFYDTIPVLSIYNEDKNYYFDIIINDFANSWYINVPDEDCRYTVKLKRVFKEPVPYKEQAVEITSSNAITIPNGHVKGRRSGLNKVQYTNWKTGQTYFKDIYYYGQKEFYNEATMDKYDESNFDFDNPSSNFRNLR